MLQIDSLKVAYEMNVVVRGVSFNVQPGKIMALIGPNGAGKSTVIRAVSGVVPIYSGSVRVNGNDLADCTTSQRARILAVVPQARPAMALTPSIAAPAKQQVAEAQAGERAIVAPHEPAALEVAEHHGQACRDHTASVGEAHFRDPVTRFG